MISPSVSFPGSSWVWTGVDAVHVVLDKSAEDAIIERHEATESGSMHSSRSPEVRRMFMDYLAGSYDQIRAEEA